MSIYPFQKAARHIFTGEIIEGLPITEQYQPVGENHLLLPGISWHGPSELIGMKRATLVLPYYSPDESLLREGIDYESK
jgi:hypothetical protein